MALTENRDVVLGTPCPDFRLPAVDGTTVSRDDFRGAPALVVMFICNHCPYVQAVEDRLIALAREYGAKGVRFVGICSNDPVGYPEDAPASPPGAGPRSRSASRTPATRPRRARPAST